MQEMAEKSRDFLRRKAIERITSELYGDQRFTDGNGRVAPFRDLVGNARLLEMLSKAYAHLGRSFDPASVVGDPDDLSYYRHRAAGLLSHKSWQDRNLGVKLIGYTQYLEKIPTLLQMLSDRTTVGMVKRIFGGDFEQVGFIRRNIVEALAVMNRLDPEVEKHLLAAMEDPAFRSAHPGLSRLCPFRRFCSPEKMNASTGFWSASRTAVSRSQSKRQKRSGRSERTGRPPWPCFR